MKAAASKRARADGPASKTAVQTPAVVDDEEDDSSDDGGPMPAPAPVPSKAGVAEKRKRAKPPRVLKFEKVYLEQLPSAYMYEKSYLHRDAITHTVVTPVTDFVITASADGNLKFWKKTRGGIEFIKTFKAHTKPFTSLSVNPKGTRLCSTAADPAVKIFDVTSFDMINMLKVDFAPCASEWVGHRGTLLALADSNPNNPVIKIYKADEPEATVLYTLASHTKPVTSIKYSAVLDMAISGDAGGVLEYWDCQDDVFVAPKKPKVTFEFKLDTDLFSIAKAKARITSIDIDQQGKRFVVTSSDQQVRVFRVRTGKLVRRFDESLSHAEAQALKNGGAAEGLDAIDLGRRLAVEREYVESAAAADEDAAPPVSNAVFDETGHFVIVPTLRGIKIINIETNKLSRILGQVESGERFVSLSLYQGTPTQDHQIQHAVKGADSSVKADNPTANLNGVDPTVVCASYKKHRLFLFTSREPDDEDGGVSRDVINEKPMKADVALEAERALQHDLGRRAVIHTTVGDIEMTLFADECPKTVENFTKLSQKGYYNDIIFHRVIKNFMVQTGDPNGDGTGGTSIWGKDFKDEFHRNLKHDREYTVSMANAGPDTNGSQFFITTVPAPWLDNKHTVFGRVVRGRDTVNKIEDCEIDEGDKPLEDISIINIDISTK